MRDAALARLVGHSLHAPNLLDHEIASVALKKLRQDWPADSVALALADYRAYDIQLHPVDIAAQFELAQRYQISAYDAGYLWLAAELRAPLATFDPKLAAAAQAHLNGAP
jgi:predicted nucleic acid-binding protein